MNAKRVSFCLLPLVLCASVAAADPVVLTAGSGGFIGGERTGYTLIGPNTHIQGNSTLGGLTPVELVAGEAVSYQVKVTAFPVPMQPITQLVNGTTYKDVFLQGTLSIAGEPFVAPNGVDEERHQFSTPMTLTGQLTAFPNFQGTGTPIFSVSVMGKGQLNIGSYIFIASRESWALMPTQGGSFRIAETSTAPVPEPATMMLLGSGLVGAAWRSRRRRSS